MKKNLTLSIITTACLLSLPVYAQQGSSNNARNVISTGNTNPSTNTTTTTTTTTTVQQQVQQQGVQNGTASTPATTVVTPVTPTQIQLVPVQKTNETTEGNFEANPVTSTPITVIPEINTNNSAVLEGQNKRVQSKPSIPVERIEKKSSPKVKVKKIEKNNSVNSITLEANSNNGIITSADVYHLSSTQTAPLLKEQVSADIFMDKNILTYNLYNNSNNETLSSYNFNNLPGLDGQFHLLLIRSDLSKTYGQVFNFSPDTDIDRIKVNLPKSFTSGATKTCDAIILSYKLKNSNDVTNVVNFVQYNNNEGVSEYSLTPNKPENCTIKLPELQATFTITNNHLVNISNNPKLASQPGKFGITAHSTESGRLELLKAEQTILISTDFSSVKFLQALPQKGTTDAMRSFYGIQYAYDSIKSDDYLVGLAFTDKDKQEWAWGKINVK